TARPAADVKDLGRRRGQKPAQEFAVQLPRALLEPVGLVARGVVRGYRFRECRLRVRVADHRFLPIPSTYDGARSGSYGVTPWVVSSNPTISTAFRTIVELHCLKRVQLASQHAESSRSEAECAARGRSGRG